jgi:beta-glucosidase-like glycosyl hydrolase/CubicO group peptidase (beta-lactamase class C family)
MRYFFASTVALGLLSLPFTAFFRQCWAYAPSDISAKAALNSPAKTAKIDHSATRTPEEWARYKKQQSDWADSVYNTMSDEERIGQLIMLRAHTDKGAAYEAQVQQQIQTLHAGGVCFFQGTPQRQAAVTNSYQQVSKIPLLVAIDGEWGISMRLKPAIVYPRQMTLGAIQDNGLIYNMGTQIGNDCKRIGVNVNFAPVIDCNTNPKNPVIGDRSFGEDKIAVSVKGWQYASGMQDAKVLACAKHFPGHGDADVDSHLELPLIPHSEARLRDIELFPFMALARQGISSMMIAHLNVPALDNSGKPSSLSRKIVTDLLRNEIGFQGLCFTDGMEMHAVTKNYSPGKADVAAITAGNDIDLLPENPATAVAALKAALADGSLDKGELEQKVKRILKQKYELGLSKGAPQVELNGIDAAVNSPEAEALRRQLYQAALTLVRNDQSALPVSNVSATKMASVAIGSLTQNAFQRTLSQYGKVTHYNTGKDIDAKILPALKGKDIVFVSLQGISRKAGDNFGVSQATIRFINTLSQQTKVVVTVFGSPYAIRSLDSAACVVAAYEDNKTTQELAGQAMFGAFSPTGHLPITASEKSPVGSSVGFKSLNVLRTAVAEEVGLSSDTLAKIDELANALVADGTAPGCQIMVVKDGAIVYHHTFGYWDYTKERRVDSTDIYDMASVTKVMATTPSLMTLYDAGKFDPERTMGDYLSELKGTNKAGLQIKQIMTHQAGLTAWVPFYKQTITPKGQWLYGQYRTTPEDGFTTQVADKMYIRDSWAPEIWKQIYATPIGAPVYKYSDLGFFMFCKMIKEQSGQAEEDYVQTHLYEPLGMSHTTYKPLEKFDISEIVPSENDHYWRHQVIQGHVHDMGAAMLGGVSGHAGLFSTAHDVATYFQMLLNGGEYGGKRIIAESTVKLFTTRAAGSNRRALGFDMKDLTATKVENVALSVSDECFGHTGFVGQGVWADPKYKLIFLFLSNRTYPTMDNNKLNTLQWRAKIQDVIYKSIRKRQ